MPQTARSLTRHSENADSRTMIAATEILSGAGRRRGIARLLPFLGPAFIASVAYVDPGNFATNLQAGAEFGYLLLWVVVASNLIAMLIQSLSAKLGIATGRNLAQMCRDNFPRWVVWGMWVSMEGVAMATDLAEFLGAALGFYLLFGMPLWIAGLLTAVVTFIIMALQRYGFRPLEAVITVLVGVIAGCYVVEMFLARPDAVKIAAGFVPCLSGTESVVLAAGILGATVMPHVIFLHSSLMNGRIAAPTDAQKKKLFYFEVVDVVLAMGIAGLVNAAMLIMAGKTFHETGHAAVDAIEKAYLTLQPLLGKASSVIFGVSLLAAGLSSSAVGTMSGQVIMQGFLNRHIPVWVRRLVTMAPALIVIFLGLDPTRTLVISQVVLSFGLPLAVIPLIMFTMRRDLMGPLVNRPLTSAAGWTVATVIATLNIFLIYKTFAGGG